MIVTLSSRSHADTVTALLESVAARGLTLFAQIDHAAGARQAGMELADELVVLVGNPRAGTPLMQRDPRVGIELPLRILVWRERESVMLGYNDPRTLVDAYELEQHAAILEQMADLLAVLAAEAAG